MPGTTILIASNLRDAEQYQTEQPIIGRTVILTPRSRHAARGVSANAIVVTPRMVDHPALASLKAAAVPSLMTSRNSR